MRTAIAMLLCLTQPLSAAENCTEDAMIVFDGSGSMGEMGFNMLSTPAYSRRERPWPAPFLPSPRNESWV